MTGLSADRIGELALRHGVLLHELSARPASLEEAFMALTADSADHVTGAAR